MEPKSARVQVAALESRKIMPITLLNRKNMIISSYTSHMCCCCSCGEMSFSSLVWPSSVTSSVNSSTIFGQMTPNGARERARLAGWIDNRLLCDLGDLKTSKVLISHTRCRSILNIGIWNWRVAVINIYLLFWRYAWKQPNRGQVKLTTKNH